MSEATLPGGAPVPEWGGVDVLSEAVRMLHAQAHDGPSDTLSVERCLREPCVTAAPWLTEGDATVCFAPGSRVVA